MGFLDKFLSGGLGDATGKGIQNAAKAMENMIQNGSKSLSNAANSFAKSMSSFGSEDNDKDDDPELPDDEELNEDEELEDDEELDEDEEFDEEDEEEEEEEEVEDEAEFAAPAAPAPAAPRPPMPPVPGAEQPLSVMVAYEGQSYGPYDRATLRQMIDQGTFTRDSYVYMDGMPNWQRAAEVAAVASLFAPAAPPMPPVPPLPGAPAVPGMNARPANAGPSEHLNHLIDVAVTDGQISESECRVLLQHAAAEGISADELQMMVEARLYERNQKQQKEAAAQMASAPRRTPAKCPHCGAPIVSLASKCPDCGYEYTEDGIAVSPWNQLLAKLEEIDTRNVERKGLRSIFENNLVSDKTNMKVQAIRNFPLPETKKGLVEFFSCCAPQAKKKGFLRSTDEDESALKNAYYIKAQQILTHARIVLKDEPSLLHDLEEMARGYKIKA